MQSEMIEFQPSKQFATIEEAIREAVQKAQELRQTFSVDCNGMQLIIQPESNVDKLLAKYWQFKHDQGVADGSILVSSFTFPV